MRVFIFIFLSLITNVAYAAFAIGFRSVSPADPSRSNREVPMRIYYPAENAGENASPASGNFPVIAFGHGWGMSTELYRNIVDQFVPRGYIFMMINTETAIFFPSHEALGKDLAFALEWIVAENADTASVFEGKISDRLALMGHSMGGGASVFAAASPTLASLMVLLAPADTSPSAIEAAPEVEIPALVFSGDRDAVTTPVAAHLPMYLALKSTCKYFLGIQGGNHCYFALEDPNGCDLLESLAGSGATISRDEQHDVLNDYLGLAFDFYLKESAESETAFLDSLNQTTRLTVQFSCDQDAGIPIHESLHASIYPQPAGENVFVGLNRNPKLDGISVAFYNLSGKQMHVPVSMMENGFELNTSALQAGLYFIKITRNNQHTYYRVVCSGDISN